MLLSSSLSQREDNFILTEGPDLIRAHILLGKVAADFLETEMFLHRCNVLKVKSLTFVICPRFLHADVLPRDPLQAMSQLLGKRTLTQVKYFYTRSKLLSNKLVLFSVWAPLALACRIIWKMWTNPKKGLKKKR